MTTKAEQKRKERAQWKADGWTYWGCWIRPQWKQTLVAVVAKLTKREQK